MLFNLPSDVLTFRAMGSSLTCTLQDGRMHFDFGFNNRLKDYIKQSFNKREFDWDKKEWHAPINEHNVFQLVKLMGTDVYHRYSQDYPQLVFENFPKAYKHQVDMASFIIDRHYCLLPAEMGTGKSLVGFMLMDYVKRPFVWVAPAAALFSIELEVRKWKPAVEPMLVSYTSLHKVLAEYHRAGIVPSGVIFDESHMAKNPDSDRSLACMHLASQIRQAHGWDGFVVCMTGTPAPKDPTDWWHQAELAMPGFIREGSKKELLNRLAVMVKSENQAGQSFPKIAAWKDRAGVCVTCGQGEGDFRHYKNPVDYHPFEEAPLEVQNFHKRLDGFAKIIFKKDCVDLPDKVYHELLLNPKEETMKTAKLITSTTGSAAQVMIKLRELSDGFQYTDAVVGYEECEVCNGTGIYTVPEPHKCYNCEEGKQPIFQQTAVAFDTPKDKALIDISDEVEELGRLVVYAGFTASIEKLVGLTQRIGWKYIKLNGKGPGWNVSGCNTFTDALEKFQDPNHDEKIWFIGHPKSAGVGLTLTAANTIVYYSNDFDHGARRQSEDRIHRIGQTKGCRIIDLFHLPSDKKVLEILKNKRSLESLTLGEISQWISQTSR